MSEHIYRHQTFPDQVDWHEQVIESWDEEPRAHLAYPLHEGEALESVALAAYGLSYADGSDEHNKAMRDLVVAVDRLAAIRASATRAALRDAAAAARDASGGRA